MGTNFILSFASALLSIFLAVNSFAAEIKIAAGTAAYANVFSKIDKAFQLKTNIKINYVGGFEGITGDTVFDLITSGQADFGAVGSTVDAWLKLAKDKGRDVSKAKGFTDTVIGRDRIQFFAHKNIGVTKLSDEQLSKIFTGAFSNWKELGGTNAPVQVFITSRQALTNAIIKERVLSGKEFYSQATTEDLEVVQYRTKISNTPGAIGFGPIAVLDSTVVGLETSTFGRPIIFLSKGKISDDARKLLDFIRDEGAKYGVSR